VRPWVQKKKKTYKADYVKHKTAKDIGKQEIRDRVHKMLTIPRANT
jgi:hypothetical protein